MTNTGSRQPETTLPGRPKRIVLTAVDSLGDLHPYIAIALGLKARGHEAVVATNRMLERFTMGLSPEARSPLTRLRSRRVRGSRSVRV